MLDDIKIIDTHLDIDDDDLSEREVTDMIVIHHTGNPTDDDLSAEQINESHINQGWTCIGYHYVIRKNGNIEKGRPDWAIGAHAYGDNDHTLGIHLSGNFEIGTPTQKQIESCAHLVAFLCDKYGIEINDDNIVGHRDLDSTACPGSNLYSQLPTIIGKAAWYFNQDSADNESEEETGTESSNDSRFQSIDDIPDWAKPTIQKMINKGLLKGDNDKNLDLSLDMVRVFMIMERAGLF